LTRATTREYCFSNRSLRLPKILVRTLAIGERAAQPGRARKYPSNSKF
jgi:hypothetical protein